MLYIMCKDSSTFNGTIKSILEDKLGMFDYEVIDPKYHKVDRTFSTVLILAPWGDIKIDAHKYFRTLAPATTLSVDEKKAIFNVFKEAVQYVRDYTLKKEILQNDVPRFADLEEFLHSFKGQVMELKLADGRFIGIYPDGDKLQLKYPAEYHVSTILNLAKLQDVLGYTKLSVKDL
jgi:hypothetical protein